MNSPIQRTVDWLREMNKLTSEMVNSWGARLATWLALGNAGALVLIFNSIIDGEGCNQIVTLRSVIWSFALGLITAFAATVINYFTGMFASMVISASANALTTIETNEYFIKELDADGVVTDENSPLQRGIQDAMQQQAKQQSSLKWIWGGTAISILVYLASAAFFAHGLVWPAFHPNALTSCAA